MRKYIVALVFMIGLGLVSLVGHPVLAVSTSNTITVQPIETQSVTDRLGAKAEASWPWYLARGSGLIAASALVVLLLSGIGQITGYTFRLLDPITAWASHRALGIMFALAVLVHMFSLLFDRFVPFDIPSILIPWLSDYRPVTLFGVQLGSLYVALGVIAFYLVGMIVLTSLFWVDKRPRLWKVLHVLSYFVMLIIFIHALYLGTDLADGLLRFLWIAAGVVIAGAAAYRAWRAYTV